MSYYKEDLRKSKKMYNKNSIGGRNDDDHRLQCVAFDSTRQALEHEDPESDDVSENGHNLSRSSSSRNASKFPISRCLAVLNLPIGTAESYLKNVFSQYGSVNDVRGIYDPRTGRSRGLAFVTFKHKKDAEIAQKHCHGMNIDGQKIIVDFSISKRAHSPTPGIYLGTKPSTSGSTDRFNSDSRYQNGRHRSPSSYYVSTGGEGRRRSRSRSPYFSSYGGESRRRSPSPYIGFYEREGRRLSPAHSYGNESRRRFSSPYYGGEGRRESRHYNYHHHN